MPQDKQSPIRRALLRAQFPLIIGCALLASGCSVKHLALTSVADELSSGTGGSFTQDEDLLFVGESLPFALKLMESIGSAVPEHLGMKLALSSGFTQYGVVFVEWPAEQLKYDDYTAYRSGLARAKGFYLRASRYALGGLDLTYPGFRSSIMSETAETLERTNVDDVPLLFWLGASWLAAVSTDLEDPEMFGLMSIASATMKRAYQLSPDWDNGAIHEILISLEPSLPMPGGAARAEEHYKRALELQEGAKAGPHVALATAVALKAQDKERFVSLLEEALAIDLGDKTGHRLANDYAQRKARFLLSHLDDLFWN